MQFLKTLCSNWSDHTDAKPEEQRRANSAVYYTYSPLKTIRDSSTEEGDFVVHNVAVE
jgi:hypothetical protein